jgi:hypothetical protein
MPVTIRIVVVLPAPFGPRKPTISPSSTVNEMPRTASTVPKRLTTSLTSIMGRAGTVGMVSLRGTDPATDPR